MVAERRESDHEQHLIRRTPRLFTKVANPNQQRGDDYSVDEIYPDRGRLGNPARERLHGVIGQHDQSHTEEHMVEPIRSRRTLEAHIEEERNDEYQVEDCQ